VKNASPRPGDHGCSALDGFHSLLVLLDSSEHLPQHLDVLHLWAQG
jgi:hypothetical protein